MRGTYTLAAGLVGLVLLTGSARAQTDFEVTPQAGPWMVCVASFTGPPSKELTEAMIQELRSKHNVPAYSFCRSAEERRKQQEYVEQFKQMQRTWLEQSGLPSDTKLRGPKTYRIEDQYAVLVGGYKDEDAAFKAAQQIRKLPPPPETLMDQTSRGVLSGDQVNPTSDKPMYINPFRSAFPVRNPTVPAEKAVTSDKPDERLKKYNAGESYSLLKNPKPWTLAIRTYHGAAAVKQDYSERPIMQKLLSPSDAGRLLDANGREAHALAELLRNLDKKYMDYPLHEAYVLHDEYSSTVTIGGFDGPDDPRLVQMQRFIMDRLNDPRSVLSQFQAKARIQFFPQPLPMPVPKF
jgi:hypothetical protein